MWLAISKWRSGVFGPLILTLFSAFVYGQAPNNSSPDSNWDQVTNEKYAILHDNYSSHYNLAQQALDWLLENRPGLHENVYKFGIRLYKGLIDENSQDTDKQKCFRELLKLYDERVQFFDHTEDIYFRKLTDAYLIGKKIKGAEADQLQVFNQAYNSFPNTFSSKLCLAYMDVVRNNFQDKNFDQDSLIRYYIRISQRISNLDEPENRKDDLEENQALIDKMFFDLVQLNCDDIRKRFVNVISSTDMDSSSYSHLIVKLALGFNCTRENYFLPALENVFSEKPTVKVALFLSGRYEQLNNYDLAKKYLMEAGQLASSKEQQAEVTMELARFYYRRGDKETSRRYVKEALRLDPGNGQAYELWGDLYFSSFHECMKGKSKVADRLVYLAAYDKYELAGNAEKMHDSQVQFPSISDIHMEDYSAGEEVTCGCWINEKVRLRKRVEE